MRRRLGLWLFRTFWLAAWSFWLWLGFGLYRELPRDLGPAVCRLPLDKDAVVVGFVGATNRVAVILPEDPIGRTVVRTFDAETGAVAAETPGPPRSVYLSLSPRLDPVRHELLFASELPYLSNRSLRKGLFALDVTTMEWRRVGDPTTYAAVHHPGRPWLLFVAWAPPLSVTIPVVVFDYETGKEVFRRNLPIWNAPDPAPFFAPGDRVAIPLRGPFGNPTKTEPRQVEVWTIGDPPHHEITAEEIPIGRYAEHTSVGRLGILEQETWTVHVFDSVQGRVVFSQSTSEAARRQRGVLGLVGGPWFGSPQISASGQRVIGCRPATLWDIDSGVVIWQSGGPHETAGSIGSDDQFQVTERWANIWRKWWPGKFDIVTTAYRSLENGELVYRTMERVPPRPSNRNAAGTLGVANDGSVFRLPPLVHYPLLVLCQTILALPLVLLWAMLRWRRKRQLRLASVAP